MNRPFQINLGLGTVQFGVPYGLSDSAKIPSTDEVAKILEYASKKNIALLDTAPSYGNSEELIGAYASPDFRLVTKTPKIQSKNTASVSEQITTSIESSLQELKKNALDGVLIHEPSDLDAPYARELIATLQNLKDKEKIKKIGISIYTALDLQKARKLFDVQIVQCPVNVFDQRLLHDGTLKMLSDAGIEIHIRSVFLKGLLIKPNLQSSQLPKNCNASLQRWFDECAKIGTSPVTGALSFIRSLPINATVLVGASKVSQLEEIVSCWDQAQQINLGDLQRFAETSTDLLDPRKW